MRDRDHRMRRVAGGSLAAGACLLSSLLLPTAADAVPGADSTVFINEIHYDNAGTDTGELVEVAAPAGTVLDGWTVVLYNGSDGGAYGTLSLAGTVADTSDGYGFVALDAPGLQNGGSDGLALVDGAGTVVQFLSYEGTLTAVGGAAAGMTSTDIGVTEGSGTPVGQSLQLTGTGTAAGDFAWTGPAATTPGAVNAGQSFGDPVEPPDAEERRIHEVQGAGPTVAITTPVVVQAVVTSLFEDNDALDGFFIQEEDADADADPATSEGLFVFCRGACAAVQPGDLVTVTGNPNDFFGMSQISVNVTGGSIVIDSSGNPLPSPSTVELPAAGPTDAEATFENVEGMIVTFADTLVVSEYFQLARYGEVVLTADARPGQFTDANAPSVAGYAAHLDDLASRRIILDDADNDQNDPVTLPLDNEPYPWPDGGLSVTNTFRGGDTIDGLTGVLHWSFAGQSGTDAWRVRRVPTGDYTTTPVNPRSTTPPDVGGDLTVASFNVLNYFVTLDVPGNTCGPSSLDCRGANSAAELVRQRDKIVTALAAIDADVFGLIEIENDAGAATADLVAALNAVVGAGTYDHVVTGTIGGDAIKVALIYKPGSVTAVGDPAILDTSVDPRFLDDRNRPALIQTFETVAGGERFTVAVNHLKSKGTACDDIGDPDIGDGQGNCNQTRTSAAAALIDHLATDPTGSGDGDVLIIGDLNSYASEDPITTLTAGGYTDLVRSFGGDGAYSYVFDGQLGYLDHALANDSLAPQVTGTAVWHINADEISLLDYNDGVRDPNEQSFDRESTALPLYAPDAFRSSDHDPVVIGLDLGPEAEVLSCGPLSGTVEELRAAGYRVVVGDDGVDVLLGSFGRDVILGLGGRDLILGLGGDDVICGGAGDDLITGGFGHEYLSGGDGDDLITGFAGNDVIDGDAGDDTLYGGSGADTVNGGADDDRLFGDLGRDVCDGGPQRLRDVANRSCETILGVP